MTNDFFWGPANPHPLSKMHTELVWEGKYDEFGRRRELNVAALAMPMQRIETVDEPRQRAEATGQLALFEKQLAGKKRDGFRNRLIWGDNKLVLPSLAEVPGKELEALRERVVRSGFDFIDFWAVDFDWQPGQPFHHDWQDYRTRKDRSLKTVSDAGYVYEKPGKHAICVKVVDVFGCDTSITVEVTI